MIMSTKPDTKYASKRRAATRKRNRELIRQIGVYFFVGLIVLGTISSVFIVQVGNSTSTVSPTPTSVINNGLGQLITQADTNIATGSFKEGIGLYLAYLAQNPEDAEVHFKVGKAYVSPGNTEPDYAAGLDHLQRALNINPSGSFAAEAQSLITQYAATANATLAAIASVTVPVTGTTSVTGTITTVAPTVPITTTDPITP